MNRLTALVASVIGGDAADSRSSSSQSRSGGNLVGQQERDDQLQDFFTNTNIGLALRKHLLTEASESAAAPETGSPTAPQIPTSMPFDAKSETIIYNHLCGYAIESTREVVEYGDAALASCSEWSSFQFEAKRSKQDRHGSEVGQEAEVIPLGLVELLFNRWSKACDTASTQDNSCCYYYPFYLLKLVPGWCALLESMQGTWPETLRCAIVERCVLPSMIILERLVQESAESSSFVSRDAQEIDNEEHMVNKETKNSAASHEQGSRAKIMGLLVSLHRLLHFLRRLVTDEAEEWHETSREACLEAVSSGEIYPEQTSPKRRKMAKLENLIDEEGCDFELTSEAIISYAFSTAVSIVTQTYSHADLDLVVEQVTKSVNILLHRLTSLRGSSKALMDLLLRQVLPGICTLSQAIRLNPLCVIRVLMHTPFHTLLVKALRMAGREFSVPSVLHVGGGDDLSDPEQEECMRSIQQWIEISSSSMGEDGGVREVRGSSCFFSNLAEDETVNNFLHSFLLFRSSHRIGIAKIPRRGLNADVSDYLNLLDSIIISIFSPSENGEEPCRATAQGADEVAGKENLSCSNSCLPGLLCRYLTDLLSWTEIDHFSRELRDQKVSELQFLVQRNLYDVLLENPQVRSGMTGDKRVLYTVVRSISALLSYKVESVYFAFSIAEQHEHFCRLVRFITKRKNLEMLVEGGGSAFEMLFSSCCAGVNFYLFSREDTNGGVASQFSEKDYDKDVLESCLTLGELGEGRAIPPRCLEWVIHLCENMMGKPQYQHRALFVFPELLISLAGKRLTRSFSSATLLRLLRLFALMNIDDRFSFHTITPLVYCFWNAIVDETTACGEGGERGEKAVALLNILNETLDITDDGSATRNIFLARSTLQNQFCLGDSRCLLTLVDFAKASCKSKTKEDAFKDVAIVFRCLFYLIRGNPHQRKLLVQVVKVQDLFSFCESIWKSSESSNIYALVQSFIHFAFEDDGDIIAYLKGDGAEEKRVIHNPVLLVPVVLSFTCPKRFDEERAVLTVLLDRLLHSANASLTESFFISKAGLFNALGKLLPLCHTDSDGDDSLKAYRSSVKKKIVSLMSIIAAQQLDVHYVKQFIFSSLISNDELSSRYPLIGDAAEILSSALNLCFSKRKDPHSYIAFRPGSGRVGVRAELSEFPSDGYSVSMWCRSEGAAGAVRTLFAIANSAGRTLIKCFINSENAICTSFLDKNKNNMELVLGAVVPDEQWFHIVIVHQRPKLLQVDGGLQVFLNGEVVAAQSVRYPASDGSSCAFFIGSPGEVAQLYRPTGLFLGQVTNIYFFPKPLSAVEAQSLYHTSLRKEDSSSSTKGTQEMEVRTPSYLQYQFGEWDSFDTSLVQPELLFTRKASVIVDPRVGENDHLYNVVDLMQNSNTGVEQDLVLYEGTDVINGVSDIKESLCLMDVVNTVIMPFLVLLVDPRLPFPEHLSYLQFTLDGERSGVSSEDSLSILYNIMDMINYLASMSFMRETMVGSGLFVLLGFVVERVAPHLPAEFPQRLMELCLMFTGSSSLFTSIYSSVFLCRRTVHCLSSAAQLQWWRCQMEAARQEVNEPRALMRDAGAQMFVVDELLYNFELEGVDKSINEAVYNFLNTLSASHTSITVDDATPLLNLAISAHDLFKRAPEREAECVEALFQIRRILYTRNEKMALYLSQIYFMAFLFPLFTSSSLGVRREAILMTCILVQRCKQLQRLMNPKLSRQRVNVVHALQYVELGWMGRVLSPFPMNVEMYMTLRSACTGDRMTQKEVKGYKPLSDHLRQDDLLPHVMSTISQQLMLTPNKELVVHAAMDLAKLIETYSWAPKNIYSISRWYSAVTDMYCSFFSDNNSTEQVPLTGAEDVAWRDFGALDPDKVTCQLMLQSSTSSIATCLVHLLLHESYGHMEIQKVSTFLMMRGAHSLLNRVLQHIASRIETELRRGNLESHMTVRSGKDCVEENFFGFIFSAEDCMYYSKQCNRFIVNEDTTGTDAATEVQKYVEDDYLYMTTFPDYEEKEPEGWLHFSLALKMAELLVLHKTTLKDDDESVIEWLTGPSEREHHQRESSFRIFIRLMRRTASFTLQCTPSVDQLVKIGNTFCTVIAQSSYSSWTILQKKVAHWSEIKKHSVLSATMSLIFIFHDLLSRRLQAQESGAHTTNKSIVALIRRLYNLFDTIFENMLSHSRSTTGSGFGDSGKSSITPWFSERRRVSEKEYTQFVVENSAYVRFLDNCLSVLKRDDATSGEIASSRFEQLQKQWEKLTRGQKRAKENQEDIQSRLREYAEDHAKNFPSMVGDNSSIAFSVCGSNVCLGISKASTAMRSSVWAHFRARVKGTMWSPTPDYNESYSRLSLAEQHFHCRRKLIIEEAGTDHHDAVRSERSGLDRAANMEESTPFPLKLADNPGSKSCSTNSDIDDFDIDNACDLRASPSMDGFDPDGGAFPALHTASQYQTFSCEVVYMLHYWSAVFSIRSTEACITIDDINTAHHTSISKESVRYLMRPESISFSLNTVTQIAPSRRIRMKRTGLEMWFRSGKSILLNFPSTAALSIAMDALTSCIGNTYSDASFSSPYVFSVNPSKEPLHHVNLNRWKSGTLSNFDYLMWLNFLAGRSLNDLSQYPIFPWVLKEYNTAALPDLTSPDSFRDFRKPIGVATSKGVEAAVRSRYEDQRSVGEVPSHYFSHYSSPYAVTFFLIRLEPFTSLHLLLQGGMFDFPDRMFHSLPSTFTGVTNNIQDGRELIPEVYFLPELCINHNRIPFGRTNDKEVMNDLILPPWAEGCPYHFVYRMREALESDYVSQNLNNWIDLIFGYKQKGRNAIDALNVYPWFMYEDTMKGRVDEPGMTDFCDNMGQIPIQLFKERHPERRVLPGCVKCPSSRSVTAHWVPVDWCAVVAKLVFWSGDKVICVSSRGMANSLRWSLFTSKRRGSLLSIQESHSECPATTAKLRARRRSAVAPRDMVEPPCDSRLTVPTGNSRAYFQSGFFLKDGPCEPQCTAMLSFLDHSAIFIIQGGMLDNTVLIRPILNPGNRNNSIHLKAHHGYVTHVAVSEDSAYIVSGARDSAFAVWSCVYSGRHGLNVHFKSLITGHDEVPSAVDVCSSLDILVTGSVDGVLLIHSLVDGCMDRRLRHPSGKSVDHILIQRECYVPNILYASNSDSVIHQMTLNGVVLRSFAVPGRLTAWCVGVRQYVAVSYAEGSAVADTSQACFTFAPPAEHVLYLHSFFLTSLNAVSLPSGMSVTSLVSDSSSPPTHIILVGTRLGAIGVLNLV